MKFRSYIEWGQDLRITLRVAAWMFAGTVLLFSADGCLATGNWVQEQLNPINVRLNGTDAKADKTLTGLQSLGLERRLVLDSSHGPTFAFDSAALTPNAKHETDGFFGDLPGSTDSGPAAGRIFIVAGHTDSIGADDYNNELGQRERKGSPDTWSARKASTRRKSEGSPMELASQLEVTAHRAGAKQPPLRNSGIRGEDRYGGLSDPDVRMSRCDGKSADPRFFYFPWSDLIGKTGLATQRCPSRYDYLKQRRRRGSYDAA